MYLYYHKDRKGNFGDDLNPWLWPKIFPRAFDGEFFHEDSDLSLIRDEDELFLGIGTLLNRGNPRAGKKVVFGSGVGYGDIPAIDNTWEFFFVRGPLSADRLSLPRDMAITDPAVLLADFMPERKFTANGQIAYMPHCASIRHGEWDKVCGEIGVKLIDPQDNVETVAREIASSSMLITEALHGAIVADALRVPWVPVVTTNQVLQFKWLDWCESIGVEYKPSTLVSLWRPDSGLIKRARYGVKLKLAERQLRSIKGNAKTVLSHESRIVELRDRLAEKIQAFERKLEAVSCL